MQDTLIGIEQYDHGVVSEIIRPAAIVPEEAARQILATLQAQSLSKGGCWVATPRQWCRYDTSGVDSLGRPIGELIGCIEAVYGATTRYEVTLYRVTVTPLGTATGWTVENLCDEPLSYGGLTLATCPRAQMQPPPKPFRALRTVPDL
ncbi:MAG TPA: hypothetical protein VFJ17_03350 [Mycobacteriales bacterium]|jgi:hypothetical protein|nr:hypothetical protein [Mycobacteriales bacterium]